MPQYVVYNPTLSNAATLSETMPDGTVLRRDMNLEPQNEMPMW